MVDLEQMLDLATPWCLRVAATLRLPEHIAAGHAGIADLAAAAGCDADALHAVLGHLVSRGVFLVDLPGTVARAGEVIESFGVAGRITVQGQSFFDPLPAGADLYLLKSVLNDWPDEPTVAILRRCAEAARTSSAAIAVLGGVAPDETPRSLGIDMLVAGGKTSTLSQFTGLARQAGLDVVVARTQSSGRYVVECRPVLR
jgi:2,7-dihydroxy-5-methyl-1-naphthoate 7-O-methyltransferase